MNAELSHRDANALFAALVDSELASTESVQLRAHLDGCLDCRADFERYERTVTRVRSVPREKAPAGLASAIVRRARRRRSGLRAALAAQADYRVPYEVIVPLLLAVAVAVVLLLAA